MLRDRPLTSPLVSVGPVARNHRRPGPLPSPARQRERLVRPETSRPKANVPGKTSSIDRCSLASAFATAISELVESPPPCSPLCRGPSRLPTLFRPVALSRLEARPSLVVHALFAHGRGWPRAACRLLQPIRSASTTTGPELRSTAPAVARWCSFSPNLSSLELAPQTQALGACAPNTPGPRACAPAPELAFRRIVGLRMAASTFVNRPVEVSQVRGLRGRLICFLSMTPPTATARGERFAPTRSARTPPVAGS